MARLLDILAHIAAEAGDPEYSTDAPSEIIHDEGPEPEIEDDGCDDLGNPRR